MHKHHLHTSNHTTLEALEQKRQLINKQLDAERERINAHFQEQKAALEKKLNPRRQEIIDVALMLLSKQGAGDLSLRDIAKHIGIKAPALYWYFKSKEELVDHIAEAILQKELSGMQVRRDDEPWQEWLIGHLGMLRKAMSAYPDGGRIVAGAHLYPAITLAKSFEYSLQSLRSAGIDIETARHIVLTATHYTFGHVIEEQAMPTMEQIEDASVSDLFTDYPNLSDIMARRKLSGLDTDHDFTVGLRYIINGSMAADPSNPDR